MFSCLTQRIQHFPKHGKCTEVVFATVDVLTLLQLPLHLLF